MSQQAGWYDDPQNAENLRYWDGVQWTDHTSPKQKPDLDRAGQAAQAGWGEAPGQGTGQGTGQGQPQDAPGQQAGYGQPGGPFAGQGFGHAYGQQRQQPQQQYGQNPYAGQTGQQSYQPMPGGFPTQSEARTRTPDGQPLAGWWHRVGARLIDLIPVTIVGILLANLLVPGVWSDYMDWASVLLDDPTAQPPADLTGRLAMWSLVIGVLSMVYEIVLTTLLGGTLGKLAVGLRVRMREQPGNIGWGPSILRGLVYQLCGLITPIYFLNVLWPLWDDKRQALHDKAARTNVVRTR